MAVDTKQSIRRSGSHSARLHKKSLAASQQQSQHKEQIGRALRPSAGDNVSEGERVRALLELADERRASKKLSYLHRCVEDAARQPKPKPDYFTTVQRGKITTDVRANIVTWMLRCNEMFGLLPESAETSVYFLDRLLSAAHIPTEKHVRIVAATCMLIAGKTCEQQSQGVTVSDLIRACGAAFSANDVQRMERVILGKFGWSCVGKVTTPYVIATAVMDVATFMPPCETAATDLRDATVSLVADSMGTSWYLKYSVVEIACGALKAVMERRHSDRAMKAIGNELSSLARADPGRIDECARMMRSFQVEDVPMF